MATQNRAETGIISGDITFGVTGFFHRLHIQVVSNYPFCVHVPNHGNNYSEVKDWGKIKLRFPHFEILNFQNLKRLQMILPPSKIEKSLEEGDGEAVITIIEPTNAMDKYDFTKKDGKWRLHREDAERASKVFDGTKKEAKQEMADYMKEHGGSVRIRKLDGKFEEERTYPRKADPPQSKG